MNVEDIKLPEQQAPVAPATQVEGQAPTAPSQVTTQPEGQAATPPTPAAPTDKKAEWDGDVNKLPPELQEWAKSVQRGFTKRSMTEADLRRKGQEYETLINSDEYKKFNDWKTNQAAPKQEKQQENAPVITPQEWEDIQLDPTGAKLASKVDAMIQQRIQAAAQTYGVELNNLKNQQNMTQFQASLSDLSDLHPEVLDWHEDGIMLPLVQEELKNPKHKSYDEITRAAYERASAINQKIENRVQQRLQQRVKEKQNLVTSPGVSNGESEITYVGDKKEAFEQAIQNALQGKTQKVKVKR